LGGWVRVMEVGRGCGRVGGRGWGGGMDDSRHNPHQIFQFSVTRVVRNILASPSSMNFFADRQTNRTDYDYFYFLWCCDPIAGHGLPLWGFAITCVGHILWMSDKPDAETST